MLNFDTQTEGRGKYTVRPWVVWVSKVKKGVPIADAEALQCSHMEFRFFGVMKKIHKPHIPTTMDRWYICTYTCWVDFYGIMYRSLLNYTEYMDAMGLSS